MSRNSRQAQRFAVYRNGQIDETLQPLVVECSGGAGHVDFAELMLDPAHYRSFHRQGFDPLEDLLGDTIDVMAINVQTDLANKHSGVIGQLLPFISPDGETIKYVSRTAHHLFGRPLAGAYFYWPQSGELFDLVTGPLVFNPEIDGRAVGNMHSRVFEAVGGAGLKLRRAFIDPDAARSPASLSLLGGSAEFWKLSDAIGYLCAAMNNAQDFITNPAHATLVQSVDDDVDLVRNVEIPHGVYLPQALDALLTPIGYTWHIRRPSRTTRIIEVQRRDTGGKVVSLYHQKVGEYFDPAKTNVEMTNVKWDAERMANRIVGRGSRKQVEVTFELAKAWPRDLDLLSRRDYKRSRHADRSTAQPAIVNAYRKWVLNETAAYVGLRSEITGRYTAAIRQNANAKELVDMTPRPLPFLPTLTLDPASDYPAPIGRTDGVFVEYKAKDGTWKAAGNWGIEVLKAEGGIYIGAEDIPVELLNQASEAAVRVTATLEVDTRPGAVATRRPASPQPKDLTADLNLESQFHWREVGALSQFKTSGFPSLAVDDRTPLLRYLELLRDRYDSIDVSGPVVLEGADQHQYLVGQRVQGIVGRELLFDDRSYRPTVPSIAGITYDIQQQKTTLHLSRMREASL